MCALISNLPSTTTTTTCEDALWDWGRRAAFRRGPNGLTLEYILTGKITKSMKMVAASRLARAQNSMRFAKAYGAANAAVFEQSDVSKSETEVSRILYIATSSDRGLCGGIHSSIAKYVRRDIENGEGKGKEAVIVALGEKPKQQLVRGPVANDVALSFNQIGRSVPTFADALAIADKIEAENIEFDKVRQTV